MSDTPKPPGKPGQFDHPDPSEFDYKPLLVALRECRLQLSAFMERTGPRNPVTIEGESLVAYIDAVARLTRVPGAAEFVARQTDEIRF